MRLVFSPAAETDLLEIADFIAPDNPDRALSFITELESACEILKTHPHIGRTRQDIRQGLRSKTYNRYVILYEVGDDHVRVERFLHGARDAGHF